MMPHLFSLLMDNTYSQHSIKKIRGGNSPRVLLNVCTHGSERVGLKVAKFFSKLKIENGTLIINIANTKAVEMRKRFVDSDLNRVFPGKKNGNHEERLAYQMVNFIQSFDCVIDVHSTETGVDSTLIVTRYWRTLKPLLMAIAPKRIVFMSATKSNALISQAQQGIAFEYGKDKDPKTYRETVRGVSRALLHLGLISMTALPKKGRGIGVVSNRKIDFFEAYSVLEKPEGFIVKGSIKNFALLRKGALIGHNPSTGSKLRATKSFYPVLFGNNSYKSIFGFIAKKHRL